MSVKKLVPLFLLLLNPLSFETIEASAKMWNTDCIQQIDPALLKEAFSTHADIVEKFINENLDGMVENLFLTNKTQTAKITDADFTCTLKVRKRENDVQILAKTPCGKGGFKKIQKVVLLVGPFLENQPGPIYAYAKSKRKKKLNRELRELEEELAQATSSSERADLESAASEIRSELRRAQKNILEEVHYSQSMPENADFLKMWSVSKWKDPSQTKGLLMEYCEYTLHDVVSSLEYPLSDDAFLLLCKLAHRISQSIAMMHESSIGLCHLDLKMGNILIKEENNLLIPKITDFGLTEKIGTPSNGPRGTLPYMAPEHFDPSTETFSPAMDNWSLGIILIELFYGKDSNLFYKNSDVDYVRSHFHDSSKFSDYLLLWKDLGEQMLDQLNHYPTIDTILRGLLTIAPENRATAQEAVEVFSSILEGDHLPKTHFKPSLHKHATPPEDDTTLLWTFDKKRAFFGKSPVLTLDEKRTLN